MLLKKIINPVRFEVLWSCGILGVFTSLQAQEFHKLPPLGVDQYKFPTIQVAPLQAITLEQLKEAGDPLRWERHHIRRMIDRSTYRAREKKKTRTKSQDEQETRLWRIRIGNNVNENWSSYPDRALDARTLSAPLPKTPKHNNRHHQQGNKKR